MKPSSPRRKITTEVCIYPPAVVRDNDYVSGVGCVKRRILRTGQASKNRLLGEGVAKPEWASQELTASTQTTFKRSGGTYVGTTYTCRTEQCRHSLYRKPCGSADAQSIHQDQETPHIQGNNHQLQVQLSGSSDYTESPVLGMSEVGLPLGTGADLTRGGS